MKKILLFAILTVLVSCKSDNNTETEVNFDVEQLRNSIIKNVEKPATTNFTTHVTDLNAKIIAFTENNTIENLNALKTTWKKTASAYAKLEPFNIGSLNNSFVFNSFFDWNADETAINNYINSNKEISEATINSQPTNTRGLSAIEFLIFDNTENETINSFKNTRTSAYLKVLGENLVAKTTKLNEAFDDFRPNFISNNETGINGGVNMLVNQMNELLEDVKRFKIGEPAGIENTTTTDISKLQAEKSNYSLELIKENINGIKAIYFGDTTGLDDFVKSITKNDDLNTKIKAQFDKIDTIITDFINTPLKDAINSDEENVKNLHKAVNELIVLIKTDVASTLSVTITFTDNDGD